MSEGKHFIDARQAWPTLSRDHLVVEELLVEPGDSPGWALRWHDLGGKQAAPKLEAFDDSWKGLHESGLVPLLADWPEKLTIADVKERLAAAGWRDATGDYDRPEPVQCPTCHGAGKVAP